MDKKLFRSILITVFFAVFLVAIIININKITGVISFFWSILLPIIISFCIAFLLNRPYEFFLKSFKKLNGKIFNKSGKEHPKLCKAFSIITVYILFLSIIALLFGLIIPQMTSSIVSLYENRNDYIRNIIGFTESVEKEFNLDISLIDELKNLVIDIIEKLPEYIFGIIPEVFKAAGDIAATLSSILIGFAMSVYMLASKEMLLRQCHNFVYAFLPTKFATKASYTVKITSEIFGDYFSGQLPDAFIIGILCYIGMMILRLPYPLLISVLIAVTNMIPTFGPFIGAIPATFILLLGDPLNALWFIIFIIILQQIDGHIIGPRLLGHTTGLPVWWTLLAILLGGGLFGFEGMILGVPTFCVFHKLLTDFTEKRKHKANADNSTVIE